MATETEGSNVQAERLALSERSLDLVQRIVLMILAIGSGLYTYRGATLLEPGGDLATRAACALFAFAVTVAFYVSWSTLLQQVPSLPRRVWPVIAVVVAFVAFANVVVSGFLSAAGFIAPAAIERHQQETVDRGGDGLAYAADRAHEALAPVASALRINAEKWGALAVAERTGRGLSDAGPGNGAVAIMLGQVASVMKVGLQQVEARVAQADALARESRELLSSMRKISADARLEPVEKSRSFADQADALRGKLVELSRLEGRSIARQAAAAARETVSTGAPMVASQKAAIGKLVDQLGQLDSLTQAAVEPAQAPPFFGHPYRPLSVYAATLRYMLDFLPILAAAIFIELVPLPLLAMRIMVGIFNRDGQGTRAALPHLYTVAQVKEVQSLLEELDQTRPSSAVQRGGGIRLLTPAE
jgi:hypothetical protein